MTGECEEVLVAGDEQACAAAVSEVEEYLVVFISALKRALFGLIDRNAIWKIAAEQLKAIGGRKAELGIAEHARDFSSGGAGDQRG